MNKTSIRNRDRYYYSKFHGAIPEGYTMHHLFYDENEYNESSFIIMTKEEHEAIHNRKILASKSLDYVERMRKYAKEHKEERREYAKKYRENNPEYIKENNEKNRKLTKEVAEFFNVTVYFYMKKLTPEVRRFMKETYKEIKEKEE